MEYVTVFGELWGNHTGNTVDRYSIGVLPSESVYHSESYGM